MASPGCGPPVVARARRHSLLVKPCLCEAVSLRGGRVRTRRASSDVAALTHARGASQVSGGDAVGAGCGNYYSYEWWKVVFQFLVLLAIFLSSVLGMARCHVADVCGVLSLFEFHRVCLRSVAFKFVNVSSTVGSVDSWACSASFSTTIVQLRCGAQWCRSHPHQQGSDGSIPGHLHSHADGCHKHLLRLMAGWVSDEPCGFCWDMG